MNLGSILPVGTIIHSMLTTTQFASEYGDNWVLADGRSVSGTKYALVTGLGTIPDMRATILRGKDNSRGLNPDGDLALGSYTADKFASHVHQERYDNGSGSPTPAFTSVVAGGSHTTIYGSDIGLTPSAIPLNTSSTGSNETAPKSVTVNIFIRIN